MTKEAAEPTGTVRAHSPDGAGGSDRKRRRKVLSCYDCRRRKLQCDRAMPACGRCTKAGQASNCLYLDDANETPMHDPDTGDRLITDRGPLGGFITRALPQTSSAGNVLGRLEFQHKRIRELEDVVAAQNTAAVHRLKSSKLPLTPESIAGVESVNVTSNDRETMFLRGKSFKTQFNGASHVASLIAYVPELNLFTKEAFNKFPALSRIRQNMKQLEDRTMYAGLDARRVSDDELKAMLPPRAEADQLLQHYLDSFDNLYPILHVPAFRKEYDEMWHDVRNARTHFVAVALLVMASAECLMPHQPWLYTANSSTARERAVSVIQACDNWISRQSQKHVKIDDFQIRFLLQLSKMVNARKFKRNWTDAGSCLRFYMAAGLHRNPELLRKPTTTLDKELRRRMWAAITEFELQVAFDRGMIASPWPMQSDCPSPTNIHDDEIDQSSDMLPAARPSSEFTKASYIVLANDTLLLRHQINSLLNNIRQTISFDDVKRITEEIESHLQNIPDWIGSSAEAPHALLSINLRQYVLALHDRQLRQGNTSFERNFSKTILLETASKMIEAHQAVVNAGNRALVLLCQDFLRAALSVCHLYVTTDPKADRILFQLVEDAAHRVISDANDLIAEKVVRYGREQRQQWIALAAMGYMKAKRDPGQRLTYMQEVVDRITKPYYRIMASQENEPSVDPLPIPRPVDRNEEMPNGMLEYLPEVQGQPDPTGLTEQPLIDLDQIAAWTFDDFMFNQMDFTGVEEFHEGPF